MSLIAVGSSYMVVGVLTVNYEDDVTCQCQCKKQPSDCNANQTLDANTCLCKCKTASQECTNEKKQVCLFGLVFSKL